VKTDSPNWQNRPRIDQQAAPLRFCGFEEVGSYQVTGMPGVQLKILFHAATNVAAHVYEHPKAGSWTELVTRYIDGLNVTLTDLRDTGVTAPPWVKTTRVSGGSTDQMFKEHTSQRDRNGIRTISSADTVREFEDGYARYMAWKSGVGMSADEVARVSRMRTAAPKQ